MYFPSGEYIGVPSLPGLVVIFLGSPPAVGTRKTSLLVLIACVCVKVAGIGDFLTVGRERVLVLTAETERRNLMRAGREVARHSAIGRKR